MRLERLFVVGAALTVIYEAVRAVHMPIVFDEASSFFSYVPHPLLLDSDNNHLLNSCFMALSSRLFGNSAFALRWHSVLGGLLYAVFSVATLRRLQQPSARLLGFTLLCLNPYILDWFSLARGYGLGLGLEAISLYCVVRTMERRRITKWGALALLAGLVAALSCLAWMYFTVACFAALASWRVLDRVAPVAERRRTVAVWAALTGAGLLPLVLMVEHVRAVNPFAFKWGGVLGVWPDTVCSLIEDTLYGAWYTRWLRDAGAMALILVLLAVLLAWLSGRGRGGPMLWLFEMLMAGAAIIALAHHLMGARYMEDRGAVWLLPILAWTIAFLCDAVVPLTPWIPSAALALSVLGMLHFASCANLSSTFEEHGPVGDARSAIRQLPRAGPHPATLGTSYLLAPSLRFYAAMNGLSWLTVTNESAPGKDFYVLPPEDARRVETPDVRIVAILPHGYLLLARQH
ncbi:MAG: glycosyltransferase family 39 protein [Candidatus Xenobia bacterium]